MFYVDQTNPKYHGKEVLHLDNESKIYLEGNVKLIEDHVTKLLKSKSINRLPKYVMIGDQYTSDVTIPQTLPNWEGIALIEEMVFDDEYLTIERFNPLNYILDHHLPGYSKYWGDNYFIQMVNSNPVRNFFVNEVQSRSRYALAAIKDIAHIMDIVVVEKP